MHKKTAIRKYFAEYLKTTITSVSNRVYTGRVKPLNNNIYPYIVVSSKEESIEERYTSHTERELSLMISTVVSQNEAADFDFDEVIEDLMLEVEIEMGKVLNGDYLPNDEFRLFEEVSLDGSITQSDESSGNDIGGAGLVYKVIYNYQHPIVPVVLEDLDISASIANMIITNEGVPQ